MGGERRRTPPPRGKGVQRGAGAPAGCPEKNRYATDPPESVRPSTNRGRKRPACTAQGCGKIPGQPAPRQRTQRKPPRGKDKGTPHSAPAAPTGALSATPAHGRSALPTEFARSSRQKPGRSARPAMRMGESLRSVAGRVQSVPCHCPTDPLPARRTRHPAGNRNVLYLFSGRSAYAFRPVRFRGTHRPVHASGQHSTDSAAHPTRVIPVPGGKTLPGPEPATTKDGTEQQGQGANGSGSMVKTIRQVYREARGCDALHNFPAPGTGIVASPG